jgi:hypothetical protein
MRFLNGLVVGFLLAIGVAYWHDRSVPPGPEGAGRQLVNWEEFARSASAVGDWVKWQLSQIADSLHRRG